VIGGIRYFESFEFMDEFAERPGIGSTATFKITNTSNQMSNVYISSTQTELNR